ncbi:MAG: helix-turn-helix transcriptional regulator [Myxococcota bacterium]
MSPIGHRQHVVGLIETAYRPSLAPETWLDQVVGAARAFDQGLGVFAAYERFDAGGRQRLGFRSQGNPELQRFLAEVSPHSQPIADLFAQRMVTVGSLRAIIGERHPAARDAFFAALGRIGIDDLWGIGATHPETGFVLVLCWPTRAVVAPRGFGYWARTGAHLAAAVRLRGAFARHGGVDPAAILTPDGRVVHATGVVAARRDVRARLADGVRQSERARGSERADAERSLDLWQALTAGRFSLVDRVERDGRRFVLALPNEVGGPSPFALSAREQAVVRWVLDGASNKVAAYAMGLSLGGFSGQLTRAMRKLHVRNRTELQTLAARSQGVPSSQADLTTRALGYAAVPLVAAPDAPRADAPPELAALAPGQRELLALVAEGLSNRAIGERLAVSPHTVRNRLATLSARLGGRSRSELARLLSGAG